MHLNNKTTTLTNKNQQKQKGTIYDNSFTSKPAKKCVAPRQRKLSLHSKLYVKDFDALILPGGSGAAMNLSDLALKNEHGKVIRELKKIIVQFYMFVIVL